MKKALLVLAMSGMLLSSGGCLNWKWWLGTSQFGYNVSFILRNLGLTTTSQVITTAT